jgi:beta-lactamase class A
VAAVERVVGAERTWRALGGECAELVGEATGGRGTVSVVVAGLDGGALVDLAGDAVHYAASTMKLPLLVAAYLCHERGEVDLDAAVAVVNRFPSAVGGTYSVRQEDDQDDDTWARMGGTATLRRLAEHAAARSGNLATNVVRLHLPPGAVDEVLRRAGCSPATTLPCGIGDSPAGAAQVRNLVTAADLALVMAGVGGGRLAAPETCRAVEAVLSEQRHRDMLPAGLPPGTPTASKSGWVDGVCHDVALVRPPSGPPYVLAVCTTTDLPQRRALELGAALSAAVWRTWTGSGR